MNIPLPDLDDDDEQNDYILYNQNRNQWNINNVHDERTNNNNFYTFKSLNTTVNNLLPEIPLIYFHQSFPYIYPETVLQLIRKEIKLHNYPEGVRLIFIDCRFAYEYNAGHIVSAYNLLTFDDLVTIFNAERGNNVILIFHCELTIDRSVKWAYIFRNYDRYCSGLPFPQLAYPNIFLLKGGFREFYNSISSVSLNNYPLSQISNFPSCTTSPTKTFQSQIVNLEPGLRASDIIYGTYLTKDDGFGVFGGETVKESQSLFASQIQKATMFLNQKNSSLSSNTCIYS